MNNELQLVKQVYALSKEKTLERDSQILLWKGKFIPEANNLSLFENFFHLFNSSNYKGTLDTPSVGTECTYEIPLNTKQDGLYYKDIRDFFSRLKTFSSDKVLQTMVSEFYIIQDDISNTDAITETWKANYDSLQKFLTSLKDIAHHSTKSDDLVFISHSEKKDISIVISSSLKEIPIELVFNKKYEDFLTDIINEDSNNLKVKAIFRSSLSEFFEKTNQPNKLYYLLDNYKELQDIYQKNYEIFVNGVSLNKIKSELAQEQLKLFEAVNKGLQNITSQAMIIPGLALFGIIMRTYNTSKNNANEIIQNNIISPNTILFIISILLSALIILISIKNQQELSRTLKSTQKISINNLDNISPELKQEITHALKQIDSVIDNSQKTLKLYRNALFIVPSIFIGILFHSFLPPSIYLVLFFIGYWYLFDRKIIKKIGIKTFKIWLTIKNRFKK